MMNPGNPRCLACGSETLTPVTSVDPSRGGSYRVSFKEGHVYVDRARICGSCGYAMLFVSASSLLDLRERWSALRSDVPDG